MNMHLSNSMQHEHGERMYCAERTKDIQRFGITYPEGYRPSTWRAAEARSCSRR